jgi:hypothetical protein
MTTLAAIAGSPRIPTYNEGVELTREALRARGATDDPARVPAVDYWAKLLTAATYTVADMEAWMDKNNGRRVTVPSPVLAGFLSPRDVQLAAHRYGEAAHPDDRTLPKTAVATAPGESSLTRASNRAQLLTWLAVAVAALLAWKLLR